MVTKTWRKHGSKQWFPGRPLRPDFLAAPPPRCPGSRCRRHSPFRGLARPQASRIPHEVCEGALAASPSRVSSVCHTGSEPHSHSSAVGWGLRQRPPPPWAFSEGPAVLTVFLLECSVLLDSRKCLQTWVGESTSPKFYLLGHELVPRHFMWGHLASALREDLDSELFLILQESCLHQILLPVPNHMQN